MLGLSPNPTLLCTITTLFNNLISPQGSLLLCLEKPHLVKHCLSSSDFTCSSAAGCCRKRHRPYRSKKIANFCGLTRWVPHRFQKVPFSASGPAFPHLGLPLFLTCSVLPFLMDHDSPFFLSEKYCISFINSSLARLCQFPPRLLHLIQEALIFPLDLISLFCISLLLHRFLLF